MTDLTAQLHYCDVHKSCPKERGGGDRNEDLRLSLSEENILVQSEPKFQAARDSRCVERHAVIRAGAYTHPPAERPVCLLHLPPVNTCQLSRSCFNWIVDPKAHVPVHLSETDELKPPEEPAKKSRSHFFLSHHFLTNRSGRKLISCPQT